MQIDRWDLLGLIGLLLVAGGIYVVLGLGWTLVVVGVLVLAVSVQGARVRGDRQKSQKSQMGR